MPHPLEEDSLPPSIDSAADAPVVESSQSSETSRLDDVPTPSLGPVQAGAANDGLWARVLAETKNLADDFALKLKYDQSKDKTIDALTDELRRHRAGLHFTLIRPLLADLVSLHDDLMQLADAKADGDPAVVQTFKGLAATVEELLARQGVSTFSLPHDSFESKQQRASRTTPTDQPELVGSVSTHLRPGFIYEDRIIRPEQVAVYVLRPGSEPLALPPPSE